jgi:hypothetical protein
MPRSQAFAIRAPARAAPWPAAAHSSTQSNIMRTSGVMAVKMPPAAAAVAALVVLFFAATPATAAADRRLQSSRICRNSPPQS